MVKVQKTIRGTFIMSIPKEFVEMCGWSDNESLLLCPDLENKGILRLIPTKRCQ